MPTEEHYKRGWLHMNNSDKQIEVLLRQCEIGYTNFERRRTYEWKICLAIWTAIAAFIALLYRGQITLLPEIPIKLLSFVGIAIVVIQFFFLYNVKHANDVDKEKSHCCEDELNKATGISLTSNWGDTRVSERIRKLKFDGWWSPVSQTSITVVLLFCAGFVISRLQTIQTYQPQKEYSIQTEVGKFTIKYEGEQYFAVTNWNQACPLPSRFRLYPPTLTPSENKKSSDKQKEALASLWKAITESKAQQPNDLSNGASSK